MSGTSLHHLHEPCAGNSVQDRRPLADSYSAGGRRLLPMRNLDQRMLDKIMPCPNTGCWYWVGAVSKNGYGNFWYKGKYVVSHRAVYMEMVGPIADELTLDHLCRNKLCCNPIHFEQVTQQVNILRGTSPSATQAKQTHCKRGHLLEGEHLYIEETASGRQKRHCYTCMKGRRKRVTLAALRR